MGSIEQRLKDLGIILPAPILPPDIEQTSTIPIMISHGRALLAGHVPQEPDGTVADIFGTVGETVSLHDAKRATRLIVFSMLASLKHELGSLDKVKSWVSMRVMINASNNFSNHERVADSASDLIVEIFGHEIGVHVRSIYGVDSLAFGLPVAIEAQVLVDDPNC